MAASIKGVHPGAVITLIAGTRGVFTVIADGKTLWSKDEMGDFPEHEQVLAQLG